MLTQFKKEVKYKNTSLKISIYEINLSKIKNKGLDIDAIFTSIYNGFGISATLLGNLTPAFNIPQGYNLSISAFFDYLVSNNLSKVRTTAPFPLINENKVDYKLGEVQSVNNGTITNSDTKTVQSTFKDISTGFSIEFITQFLKNDTYITLNLKDSGTVVINTDGTYKMPNRKELKTKLVFNNKKKKYYIPFSRKSSSNNKSNNSLFKDTFLSSIFQHNKDNSEDKKIIIEFEIVNN